jgi:REP element-mobilizing transposase RayT
VGACKDHSVADVVRRLKGASSRRIRQGCWDSVKSKLWGEAFWSGGYFYRSVGSTTGESIQHYIERSQGKHWTALDYEEYRHRQNMQTTINQFMA